MKGDNCIPMAKIVDENGFWLIKSNPITKEGVFPYLGRTISPQLEPDKIYSVYRSFDELSAPETLKSFDGVPFINDHEMLGQGFTPYDKRQAAGVLMNPVAESGVVRGDLKIFSESLKDAISGGKKELSLGYKCDYALCSGEWNGQKYDAVQRNIRGNHIALVTKGRMGSDVRVYDGFTFDAVDFENDQPENETQNGKGNEMAEEEKKDLKPAEENGETGKDEKVDKRKLIDEIGGFLKDKKLSDEDIRFVIGKAEELSYNDSESGKTDEEEEEAKPAAAEEEKKDDAEKPAEKSDEEGKDADPEEEKKEDKPEDAEKKDDEGEDACGKDACGKDMFYDAPKVEKLIDQLQAAGKLDVKNLREGLKSTLYQRRGDGTDSAADLIRAVDTRNALAKELEPIIGAFSCDGMTAEEVAAYACGKLGLDQQNPMPTVQGYIAAWRKSRKTYTMDNAEKRNAFSGGLSDNLKTYLN